MRCSFKCEIKQKNCVYHVGHNLAALISNYILCCFECRIIVRGQVEGIKHKPHVTSEYLTVGVTEGGFLFDLSFSFFFLVVSGSFCHIFLFYELY